MNEDCWFAAVKPSCVSVYLLHSQLGAIGLQHPQGQGSVVREVGVIWAGTEQVKCDGDVKREHADRHVPAIQHGGHTAVQEDAGEVEREVWEPKCQNSTFRFQDSIFAIQLQSGGEGNTIIFLIHVLETYRTNGQ